MNVVSVVKKTPVCFGLAVLAAVFFASKVIFAVRYMLDVPWLYLLRCAAPLLLFGGVFVLRAAGKLEKGTALETNVVVVGVLVFVLVCNTIAVIAVGIKDGLIHETTDAGQYGKVLWTYGYPSKSMCQFPGKIPKDARNVSFWENPQFLQGGSRVYLMFETTPQEIRKYRRKYEPLAKAVLPAGTPKQYREDYYVPSPSDMDRELTDAFEVMILDGTPFQNHGFTTGLAVNEKTNEIFLFRETW